MIDTKELRTAVEAAGLNAISMQEVLELFDRLEEAEKERDWSAERLEDAIEELTALRAKIEAMEKQEPVGHVWRCDYGHMHGSCERELRIGQPLYALPGAKGE